MFALGSAAAGGLDGKAYAVGQLAVTAAQLTAHYVNEWADLEADQQVAHRTLFSGGSGVLVEGLLPRSVALRAARSSTAVAIGSLAALSTISVPASVLGLCALIVSWIYSAPPIRLLATGWGEAATSLVVAVTVPLIGDLSQGGTADGSLLSSVGILFVVHLAMMLAFELPDLESDALSGKRVLAVRLGRGATLGVITTLLVGAVSISYFVGTATNWRPGVLAGAAGVGPVLVVVAAAWRRFHRTLTTSAVLTFVVFSGGLLVGLTPW